MPFRNLNRLPEEEYFSDGMTEELMHRLSRVEGLRVTARTSAFAFKGQDVDAREIGKVLNVRYVLEGSVRRDGQRMRVSIQLINTADGFLEHAGSFEEDLGSIFAIQDALASQIAHELKAHLSPETRSALQQREISSAVYDLYLRARYQWNQQFPGAVQSAQKMLE
ncbi:MAG: hypothetical protein AAF570_10995, partial [Bacteroidota bacterium]